MIKISKKKKVRGLPNLSKLDHVMCHECQKGKMTKYSFKSKNHSTKIILELVHTDLCGPMRTQSYYGDRYFILFADDYTRLMIVMFLKEKSEAFKMFKWYKAKVEKETGKELKCLRSDRGGEFISNEFTNFCNEHGIKRQVSAPRTPQQNGIAKRRNRSIVDYARTLMIEKNVAQTYWREVVSTAVYVLNQVQLKKDTNKALYELWFGHKPTVSYFKNFGSKCFILKDERNGKFDSKGDEGIFLGYSTKSQTYKCLNKVTNKMIESANVRVDEFDDKNAEESTKEPEDYGRFTYIEHPEYLPKPQTVTTDQQENNTEEQERETDEQEGPTEQANEPEQDEQERRDQILTRFVKRHHPENQIIGDKQAGIQTRSKSR